MASKNAPQRRKVLAELRSIRREVISFYGAAGPLATQVVELRAVARTRFSPVRTVRS